MKQYKIVPINENDVELETINFILKTQGGYKYSNKEEAKKELKELNSAIYEKLSLEYCEKPKRKSYLKLI